MRRKIKNYSGMTLLELLVSIAIFVLGIAGFTLLFIRTWQLNKYTLEMGQSSMLVSQGVSKMVNYIRGARQGDDGSYPIVSASGNDLVLYSDYNEDGVTERLHFYLNGQNILMGITNPTNGMPITYPAGDQQTITIASNIVNNNNTPIFYYYDENYPGDTTNNPMPNPINVPNVRMVKVYLQINIDPNRPPNNIQMQNFVEIRNLNDYDRLQ